MKIVKHALATALAGGISAALASGCGGSSAGNAADTGLPPDKLLSDVTPAEATSACQRVERNFERRFNENTIIEAVCTMIAAANTTSASACTNLRDACIEEAQQPDSEAMMELDLDAVDFGCDMANFGECGDATVAELETCLDDTLDTLDGLLRRYDCSDAGSVTEADLEAPSFEPAQSCERVSCNAGGSPFGG